MDEVGQTTSDAAGDASGAGPESTDRRRLARWLRWSIVLNVILVGVVLGSLVSGLVAGRPDFMPPLDDGAALEELFAEVIDASLSGAHREEALAILRQHRAAFDAAIAPVAGDGTFRGFDQQRMAAAFQDGTLTAEMAAQWHTDLATVGDAHWGFFSGLLVDLAGILDPAERARFDAAMAERMPPPPPPSD